jgi:hypothetical protein
MFRTSTGCFVPALAIPQLPSARNREKRVELVMRQLIETTLLPLLRPAASPVDRLWQFHLNRSSDASADPFDETAGSGATLRPRSKEHIRYGYARWLAWLARELPEALACRFAC